mgnify:CR=1 FL=1
MINFSYRKYTIFFNQNQLSKAKEYGLKAFELAQKTNFPSEQKNAAEILSQIFFKEKDFQNAYKYKTIASDISEKIYFDESKDIALKATYQYETEKKEAAIKALHQKNRISELESKRKSTTLYLILLFFENHCLPAKHEQLDVEIYSKNYQLLVLFFQLNHHQRLLFQSFFRSEKENLAIP